MQNSALMQIAETLAELNGKRPQLVIVKWRLVSLGVTGVALASRRQRRQPGMEFSSSAP